MAPPADPPFANARLTPEEAERLAATFRPSWELDDAPFTGAAILSDADIKALQRGAAASEVRTTMQQQNGAHAAAPARPPDEVAANKAITQEDIAQALRPAPVPKIAAKGGPTGTVVLPPDQAPKITKPAAIPAAPLPATGDFVVPRKSKGPWIGIGAAFLLALAGGVLWMTSGGGEKPKPAAVPTPETTIEPTALPPPAPPESPATTAQSRAAAAATTRATAPAPPPKPPAYGAYGGGGSPPLPKPAPAKPAGKGTIVRDAPF